MIVEDFTVLLLSAILLAIPGVAVLGGRRRAGLADSPTKTDQMDLLRFKNCPQCSERLSLSALVCDACDYNFLAGFHSRYKLLPAPDRDRLAS